MSESERVGPRRLCARHRSSWASYADYSHGIRFVQPTMVADGLERATVDVARDPELCALVSGEGPLRSLRAAAPFG